MVDISVYIHYTYFIIKTNKFSPEVDVALSDLKKYLTDYEMLLGYKGNRSFTVKSKIYYHNKNTNEYMFPISLVGSALQILKTTFNLKPNKIIYVHKRHSKSFKFKIKDHYKLRDYQELYLNAIIKDNAPPYVLIDLKPGAGKTFISVNAIQHIGKKVAVVILPKYMDKWVADFELYTDIPKERIFNVAGGETIKQILDGDTDYDVFIMSIRTLYNYINGYEKDNNIDSPTELFRRMGVGVLLSDESHQETSALSRIVMYSNVEKVIGLSATYLSNNKKEQQIQEALFPSEIKVSNLVRFDPYINIVEVGYTVNPNYKFKIKSSYGYSHYRYETNIKHMSKLKETYYDMILRYLKEYYLSIKKKGEKAIIFFSSIDMCTDMRNWLAKKLPDLKINRYVGEDQYSNLLEGDIVVTTIQSAGTAVDIPNLICVLNTVIVTSSKVNIQVTGRLRKIENRPTTYVYFLNRRLPQHRHSCNQRERTIKHMGKSYYKTDYQKVLGVH